MEIDLYAGDGLGLADAAAMAEAAEAASFGALWTLEAATEPFLPLALAAEHTSRIGLGTAVAVALARNPMVVAHLAHELNRYSGGRLHLGLGSQVRAHITRRFGEPFDHPADRMREFTAALRAIWACWDDGEPLDFHGRFHRHDLMTPVFCPERSEAGPPRILLSAVGPRMTAVAAEVADGMVAHPLSSRRVVEEVIRPRLGRPAAPGFALVCPVMVVTGRDGAEMGRAREAVRRQIAFYASTPAYREVLDVHGAGGTADRLRVMARAGRWAEMADLVTDDLLADFSVEAPVGDLVGALRSRFDGVLDRLLVYAPYPVEPALWSHLGLGRSPGPLSDDAAGQPG